MARIHWRRLNSIFHRDIGYAIVGLTIVYGISGIAVNHGADWNPNYRSQRWTETVPPVAATTREAMVREVAAALHLAEVPATSFRPDPFTLQMFLPGTTYSVDLPTGHVLVERVQARPVVYEMNQLHLHTPKGMWTLIADVYAGSLIVVALTGLFVLKGRAGIAGRGAWITAIGVAGPLVYWVVYAMTE